MSSISRRQESSSSPQVVDDDDEDALLLDFLQLLPKIELHAHLNGCIRESTLFDLAQERNVTLSDHHFGPPDSNNNNNNNDDDPFMYNVRPRSLQDCFDMFAELPACVNDLKALRRITQEALEDFAVHHHVVYLELRSTPKRLLDDGYDASSPKTETEPRRVASKLEYVRTILSVIKDFERQERERYEQEMMMLLEKKNENDCDESSQSHQSSRCRLPRLPMVCRFLVAVDRSQSLQDARENIQLAMDLFLKKNDKNDDDYVVGVDLGGNPTQRDFGRDFVELFQQAREAGLGVTIHCAEIPCGNDDDDPSDDDDDESLQQQQRARAEAEAILDFGPDRIGHALLLPPSLLQVLKQRQIPVETCPTSNVMTLELAKLANGNLLHGLQQHPALGEWLENKHPLTIGTDDPGVFDTTATKELFLLAKAWNVSKEKVAKLVLESVDYAFCDSAEKKRIKELLRERIDWLLTAAHEIR